MQNQALSGLKVVGFVTAGVGPMILRSLGSNGAIVIHVESRKNPDITRSSSPFKDKKPGIDNSYLWVHTNPDNYSFVIDMKHSRSMEVAKKLIKWADVVIDNYRPDVMDSWRLGYDELKKINPKIISLRSSQQGLTGPHRMIAAAGPHLTGLAGFVALTGYPDRMPVSVGAYPDFVAPPFGMAVLLAALEYRRKTGKGQLIDLSQFETSSIFLAPAILDFTVNQRIQTRNGNKDLQKVPHGVYRCLGDDKWCAIVVSNDAQWQAFCRILGQPEWINDEKFSTISERKQHEDELNTLIEKWAMDHNAEDIMDMMQQAGVEAGVVRNMGDIAEKCPQTKHRHYLTSLQHPIVGENILAGNSYILSKTPYGFKRPAPCFGEHNHYVCTELLGMSDTEFVEFEQQGLFQ